MMQIYKMKTVRLKDLSKTKKNLYRIKTRIKNNQNYK